MSYQFLFVDEKSPDSLPLDCIHSEKLGDEKFNRWLLESGFVRMPVWLLVTFR